MRTLFAMTLLALFFLPTVASAEVKTITATHTYIMGDNDSRNDARQLCFMQAKRKVLEKAGSFIQTSTEVRNFQLTKDQISSYSAAVLSVEITKEDFGFNNGHNELTITVKADIDVADVQKRLAAIVADKSLQERITAQQQQIQELEQQVQKLNSSLSVAPVGSSRELRKERTVVFGNIQELENIKIAAAQRITAKTDIIRRYIIKNMTAEEVLRILGQPQKRVGAYYPYYGEAWFYGEKWVCFGLETLTVKGVSEDSQCYSNELKQEQPGYSVPSSSPDNAETQTPPPVSPFSRPAAPTTTTPKGAFSDVRTAEDMQKNLDSWRQDLDRYVALGKFTQEEADRLYQEREEFLRKRLNKSR